MASQSGLPTTPLPDRSSIDEQQAMLRKRTQNDAVTRTDLPIPANSSLMREGFTYQKYRVGGPPLQLLPLRGIEPDENDPAHIALQAMLSDIEYILTQHQVTVDHDDPMGTGFFTEIMFLHMIKDESPPTPENLTISIPAVWDDAQPFAWLRVVSELRHLLLQTPCTASVRVEITASELFHAQTFEAVEEDHPIVQMWNSTLQTQLYGIITLSERLRTRLCSLGVVRLGYIPWDGGSPLPTVVLVVVNWDIDPHEWEGTQLAMREALRENGLVQVEVVFARGEISVGAFPLQGPTFDDILRDKAYSTAVNMGADLGPAKFFTKGDGKRINGPCGTMGGYLKVTNIATGEVKRMGLTTHHVAREAMEGVSYTTLPGSDVVVRAEVPGGSEVDVIDCQGMGPDYQGRQMMKLESPSRRKHISTMRKLQADLRKARERQRASASLDVDLRKIYEQREIDLQNKLAQKKHFFADKRHLLGTIWASSGFKRRTRDNGRLDWALVEFQDEARLGKNVVPPAAEWERNDWDRDYMAGQLLTGIQSCKNPRYGGDVMKTGSNPGMTKGRLNKLRHTVKCLPHDNRLQMGYSEEYVLVSKEPHCALGTGESGSAVFDMGKRFLGLLWGGLVIEIPAKNALMYVVGAEEMVRDLNGWFQGEYRVELAED